MTRGMRRARRVRKDVIREFEERGVGWYSENPKTTERIVRLQNPALADRLDFGTARLVPRSHRPPDLRKQESDLVWELQYKVGDPEAGQTVWVLLLVEHQSRPERFMALRILTYQTHLWNREVRRFEQEKVPEAEQLLPLVVPIVFYTGSRVWEEVLPLAKLMEGAAAAPELTRYLPQGEIEFLPLEDLSEAQLLAAPAAGPALLVLQASRGTEEAFARVFRLAEAELHALPVEEEVQWVESMHFLRLVLWHRRSEAEQAILEPELIGTALESKFGLRAREEVTMRTAFQALQEQERAAFQAQVERAQADAERARTAARRMARQLLEVRLGPLPAALLERLESADAAWCEAVVERAREVESSTELRWQDLP